MAFFPRKLLPLNPARIELNHKYLEVIISPTASDIERHFNETFKHEEPEKPLPPVIAIAPPKKKSLVNLASKKKANIVKPKGHRSKPPQPHYGILFTKGEEEQSVDNSYSTESTEVEEDKPPVVDEVQSPVAVTKRKAPKRKVKKAAKVAQAPTPTETLSEDNVATSETPPEPEVAHVTVTKAPKVVQKVYDRKTPALSVKMSEDKVAISETLPEPEVVLPTITRLKSETREPLSKSDSIKPEVKLEPKHSATSQKSTETGSSKGPKFKKFPDEKDLAEHILEAMFKRDAFRENRFELLDSLDSSDHEKESKKKEIHRDSISEKMHHESSKKRTDMQRSSVEESLDKTSPIPLTTEAQPGVVVPPLVTRKFVTKVKLPKYLTEDIPDVRGADKKTLSEYSKDYIARKKDLKETKDEKPGKLGEMDIRVPTSAPLTAEKQKDSKKPRGTKARDFKRKMSEYVPETETEVDETDRSIPDFVPKRKVKTQEEIFVEDILKRGEISKLRKKRQTLEKLTTTPPEIEYEEDKKKTKEDLTSDKYFPQKSGRKEKSGKKLQNIRRAVKQKPGREDFEKTLTVIKRESEAKQENWLENLISKDDLTEAPRKKSVQPARRDTDGQLMASQEASSEESSEFSTTSTSEEQEGFLTELGGTQSTTEARQTDKRLEKMKEQFFKTRQRIRNAHKKEMERSKRLFSLDVSEQETPGGVKEEDLHGQLAGLRKTTQRLTAHDVDETKELNVDPKTLVKKYMTAKQIYQIFQFFMNQLLVDYPEEPLDYLINLVRTIHAKQKLSRQKSTIFVS